ncbi:MAG: DUF4384 domain-containing protein [Proteobacteria bacterium]|nr:DUF4384 domain-containing protein [Pseudomonadota bacterium]
MKYGLVYCVALLAALMSAACATTDSVRVQAPIPPPTSRPSPDPRETEQNKPARLDIQANRVWGELEALVDRAGYRIDLSANQTRYRVGDELVISCRVPRDGYLNVFTADERDDRVVILFPNRYHQDNWVRAGTIVSIPGPGDRFLLKATPPAGRSLVVVFHTDTPINAYTQGQGSPADLFRTAPKSFVKLFEVEESATYGAASLVTYVDN